MFLFFDPPGHGQSVCLTPEAVGPGQWSEPEALVFTNPDALLGGATHKPFVVMDPYHPNRAACVEGEYYLLTVSTPGGHKVVQRATASTLAGPWTLESAACIPRGEAGAFDAKHIDAVSGYFFPERESFLYFYMGYPDAAQRRRIIRTGGSRAPGRGDNGDEAGHHPSSMPAIRTLGVRLGRGVAVVPRNVSSLDCRAQCFPDRSRSHGYPGLTRRTSPEPGGIRLL